MTDAPSPTDSPPRVDVLLATFNGRQWIEPQVESILEQRGVAVRLIVSDDGSTDGTVDYLRDLAARDPRVRLLPPRGGRPGVSANFLHLFETHPVTGDCFVAFSDQDDVWVPDKLRRQVELLRSTGADAVSSNVMSFDEGRRRRLIVKNAPQQKWDFLFEAAGPGSTYVFTPSMHARLVGILAGLDTSEIGVHDWFLYALVRAAGGRWHIDADPLVDYRQHGGNVQGEHHGAHAFQQRFETLRSGFYRRQFILTARACRQVGATHQDERWIAELDAVIDDLTHRDVASRWRLATRWREIRRDRTEGIELALACLLGVW